MSSYAWEFISQLVALHMTADYPSTLISYTDCTAAQATVNLTLRTKYDRLVTRKMGLLASCAHVFSDTSSPRQFSHIPCHPERAEARRTNPSRPDESIFIADQVAGGTEKKLGGREMRHHANTLALNNIYDELIPLGLWHCRNIDNLKYPILDDVLAHHHACIHRKYHKVRDGANRMTWSQTNFQLA